MAQAKQLFSPIKSLRSFEEVSANIKELIFDGTLRPGDRLPSESDLAQQFNVGRQTIREALRILELSGFISVQKGGGGSIIKDTILNSISSLFIDAFRYKNISIVELTRARIAVEKVVLKEVLIRADQDDLKAMRECLERAKQKVRHNTLALDENIEFHMILARASKNMLFEIVVGSIGAVVKNQLSRLSPDGDRRRRQLLKANLTIDYHQRILDAIETQNNDLALDLMEEHLWEVQSRLELVLTQQAEAD